MENLLCGFLRDDIALKPALNVAPRVFRSGQLQRLAADQRHAFGFDFPQIARRRFTVRECALRRVAEQDAPVRGRSSCAAAD